MKFNELVGNIVDIEKLDVKRIEYIKSRETLNIQIGTAERIQETKIEQLKNQLMATLSFIKRVDVSIISDECSREMLIESNWENIMGVVKRKSPAVASILNQSKIRFENDLIHITFDDKGLESTFHQFNTTALIQKICDQNLDIAARVETAAEKEAFEGFQAFERMQEDEIQTHIQNNTGAAAVAASVERAQNRPSESNGNGKASQCRLLKGSIRKSISKVADIVNEEEVYAIEGEVISVDTRELQSGKTMIKIYLSDHTDAICAKMFVKKNEAEEVLDFINANAWLIVEGTNRYDTYDREKTLNLLAINAGKKLTERMDNAEDKRVELHMHTNMSEMDGMTSVSALIKTAIKWGHPAIAITDHGALQAFPDADHAGGDKIKVIYGVEGYLVDDVTPMVDRNLDYQLNETYIVFDIETTGFSNQDDRIIEIGAVKIKDSVVVDRYSVFVNPERQIPSHIVELTGINYDMVADAPTIEVILPEFLAFVGDAPVVAHNAVFDCSFIRTNAQRLGLSFDNAILDTLALSRLLLTQIKKHNLKAVTKHLKIALNDHHRAVADAEATARVLIKFIEMLTEAGVSTLEQLNVYASENMDFRMRDMNHIIILAKNYQGLRHLYELVSMSNLEYFYRKPRMLKSKLIEKREGLILGSACEAGELYKALLNNLESERIASIASFYDYLEIQPLGNNNFMIENGRVKSRESLADFNKAILALGDQLGKPVVATCDVHFLNPDDEVYRRILMAGSGYSDADNQAPLYFRTTDEMLKEFDYLGSRAKEVVIDNTRLIADMCDAILPVPKGTFPPKIEGADEAFREMCFEKATRIYGDPLPEIVEKRLNRELNSIISNGYAVMYIIAQKLVTKSLEDGYLVGSRGSVGSSLAATMSDITEVNPLPPHYICKNCKHSEWITDGSYGSGCDMPDKVCPECGTPYFKDGYDIPFETFLGFDGDKEPDIDLNFAGVYQANAHKYCEVLFGKGKTFKAGTIGTIADKTAFGYVKKYFEERETNIHYKEVERLAKGLTGIKRTSGQHPGGIMVVPSDHDIHEFCPIQYPANDVSSDVITTHFDYHSISGRLLKLDILGHDVPTIIKQLEELTGMDVFDIPIGDPDTMKIFTSIETLNIKDPAYSLDIGSLGIPEFGTKFVRQMLKDTEPKTFSDLVRISGLSHGTDVWLNNAQTLVRENIVTIKDVIATRDDIMNYLLQMGLEPLTSFKIMEKVRKGKGLGEQDIIDMKAKDVPDWYIRSCQTIQYMFPKAHAVAYVMMSVRIAYFKVHQPLAFYATYYASKVDDFDAELICKGVEVVRAEMKRLEELEKPSKKEQDFASLLEIVDEMYSRGLQMLKVSIKHSDAEKFKIKDGKLLPPFLALQGVGASAAQAIAEVRDVSDDFMSIEDFQMKTRVSKTVVEAMKIHGCFEELPDANQLSFF
ncbi:MAG: polymerase subunit alpha, Gram-positive type [Clostridiales bacterium]|jgi:DNA polymerase-3 subunit alpha (Gram-positive type)|nr:polymerase subunit alpha, Gram-positive type [Clostridiales bacterium]MDN5298160.1 polymerase subunit alpha, Gram-positive type [Clostridiales bacterium]